MTDSIDKKSDEKRDNLKVDLDAMLDKAESSLRSKNETLDDEDAIDRLLMDTGFNVDDELERAALHIDSGASDDHHDELDDLLGFDNFSDDFKAPEAELGGAAKAGIIDPSDEEEDELDLLLMNVDLDDELVQSEADQDDEALQSFDDFSGINEPIEADAVPPSQTDLSEQADEHLSPSNEDDELADLFGDGFNESDLIQDEDEDEDEDAVAPVPDVAGETSFSSDAEAVIPDEEDEFADLLAGGFDELDLVQDDETPISNPVETEQAGPTIDDAMEEFDPVAGLVEEGFNETDLVQDSSQEVEALAPIETEQSGVISNTDQTDESDEGNESVSLIGEGSGEPVQIQGEEMPGVSSFANEEQKPFEEQVGDTGQIEEPDNLSDFSDFNEPDAILAAEDAADDQSRLSSQAEDVVPDEVDQFAGLFDDSGLMQEAPVVVEDGQEPLSKTDEISQTKPADESEQLDDFLNFNEFNASDSVEDSVVEATDDSLVSNEADEFADLFSDGFDESDLIQDEENVASVPAETTAESPFSPVSEAVVQEEDEFADLLAGGFDESDLIQAEETPPSESAEVGQTGVIVDADHFADLFGDGPDEAGSTQPQEPAIQESVADQPEVDEFAGLFGEGFDETDLLQDQEAEAAGLTMSDEQQKSVELAENGEDSLFPETDSDAKDELFADRETGNAQNETDEFAGLGDNFDDADLIQDEANKALADEESFSDLQTDEDGFDSLFTDVGFDVEETPEQAPAQKDEFGDDSDLHDFFQLNENNSGSSGSAGDAQLTDTDKSLEEDDFLLPDFDITADSDMSGMDSAPEVKQDEFADAFGDSDFLNEVDAVQTFEPGAAELKSINDDTIAESEPQQSAGTAVEGAENVQLAQFAFEREDMQKQLDEAEKKTKKAKLFGYIALGFGGVALTAAAGLGFMAYHSKEDVAKLTATVSELQANLEKNVALPPKEEINAMRNSVVQLNQQVNGFITELKGKPQFLVDLLNNKVPDIAAKQDMVSKALQVLQVKAGIEGGEALETAPLEPVKIAAVPQPEPVKEEPAPAKNEPVVNKKDAKPAKEAVTIKPKPSINMGSAKSETVETTAPAKAKIQPEDAAKLDKPAVPPKAEVKEDPVKAQRPEPVGKWGVNLAAFKQEWFAKSKAAEFARQGIFAEVIPVYEKNTTMYRLRVGGFKTKAEASANTARIKQALNLDSVWVSDN